MRASDRVLSRRYAQALFLSARERAEEGAVRLELVDALRALHSRLDSLKNPVLSPAVKKAAVQGAAPGLSRTAADFLGMLIDKKRIGLLAAIVGDLERIHDEHAGRVRAQVRSASELGASELQELSQRLKAFSGKEVALEVKVDPELLGGVVVRMADTVLDGSLQGKLKLLAARLIEE